MPRLCPQANNPGPRIFEVYLGIPSMYHGKGDATPTPQLHQVFDGADGDAEHLGVAGEEKDASGWGEGDLGWG